MKNREKERRREKRGCEKRLFLKDPNCCWVEKRFAAFEALWKSIYSHFTSTPLFSRWVSLQFSPFATKCFATKCLQQNACNAMGGDQNLSLSHLQALLVFIILKSHVCIYLYLLLFMQNVWGEKNHLTHR